jgi:hypothetical protein
VSRRRSARSYVVEVLFVVASLIVMINVVLPAAGSSLADQAANQFLPSPSASFRQSPVPSPTKAATFERKLLDRAAVALAKWNAAGARVMADANDTRLSVEGFRIRTMSDRGLMRSAVSDLEALVDARADPRLVAALQAVVKTYRAKIDAVDGFAAAAVTGDLDAMDGALRDWQAAITSSKATIAAFAKVADPYLTAAERATWAQSGR